MQLFLLASLVAAASAFVEVQRSYHEAVGIPLAASIKDFEDAAINNLNGQDERIVGGVTAPITIHPYLAGLLISFSHTWDRSVCGSSIISTNRVVTAAHCWNDGIRQASSFEVVLGSPYLFSGGTRVVTSAVVMHPQWMPSAFRNDVAMVYLPISIVYSPNIQPVSLPTGSETLENFAGQWAFAAGYGKTNDIENGISSNAAVHHVSLRVITLQQCVQSFGNVYVTSSTLCTDGLGGVGVCGGDSGGPLVVQRGGRHVLVGISSFVALNGCQLSHPSAFARVTSFLGFISQHL